MPNLIPMPITMPKNYYYTCPKCNEDFEPKNFWASLWAWESSWACNPFTREEITCTKCGHKDLIKYIKKKDHSEKDI